MISVDADVSLNNNPQAERLAMTLPNNWPARKEHANNCFHETAVSLGNTRTPCTCGANAANAMLDQCAKAVEGIPSAHEAFLQCEQVIMRNISILKEVIKRRDEKHFVETISTACLNLGICLNEIEESHRKISHNKPLGKGVEWPDKINITSREDGWIAGWQAGANSMHDKFTDKLKQKGLL